MLPHTLITASAGSGKTWRLTVRYLRLVMMGAEPESIVALTFSRKAAGEFFNAILHRLAEAAAGHTKAEALARDIGMPGTTVDDFCQALARLTARLPFLMLGTLDSFFIRMARSFPFELGLSGDFTLLDPHQLSVEKLRVYDRVFAPDAASAGAQAEFRRAFTEATFGKDEMRVRGLLDDFIAAWHHEYLTTPDGTRWGNPERIWPENSPLSDAGTAGGAAGRGELIRRAETALGRLAMSEAARGRWTAFLTEAAEHVPGAPMGKAMEYLWDKLLDVLPGLRAGSAEIVVERKRVTVDGPLAEALHLLCRGIMAGELDVALRQTRGIFEVIRKYDSAYHILVRRQGRLTFHDVQLILSGALSPEASGESAREARLLTHEENRGLMDYRLDARYDHWLLDEFQDTSRVQWRVLANLMDEAIQDSEGRKSFFAVGDQKQSIYEWRGGTPELFEELVAQYNLPGLPPEEWPLQVEPMSLSQRSGPAVIAMVNTLLGDSGALAEVLPPAAVAKWRWQEHISKNQHYGGTAQVIEVPAPAFVPLPGGGDETEAPEADPAWRRAAELISELKPLKRGLTCAVLCHRNDRALLLTDFLRAATGMPVVCESDLSIAEDNPATSVMLSLLQCAAHPGDLFAWNHVMMSPLAGIAGKLQPNPSPGDPGTDTAQRRALAATVLRQTAESGFHDTLRWWVESLIGHLRHQGGDLDLFSQGRLEELCGCARAFDNGGSRDIDEFLAFARSWTARGASHDGALQVMTVHRSKGLTFDVVIIPDLGYRHTFLQKYDLGRDTGPGGEVNWLTRLPNKEISEADPTLALALERSSAAVWAERIAGLYVMVTRAKYANYILLPPAPKSSTGISLPAALRHMLRQEDPGTISLAGTEYPLLARFGDPDWIQDHPLKQAAPPHLPPTAEPAATVQPDLFAGLSDSPASGSAEGAKSPAFPQKTIPLRARRPSAGTAEDDAEEGNSPLFPEARLEARTKGELIHRLLSLVRWADAEGLGDFENQAAALFPTPDATARAALETVRNCLRAPALKAVFQRPDEGGNWEVWRERAYDVILEGEWNSGVFDRVLIQRADSGEAMQARVLDFKTGTSTDSSEALPPRARAQLEAYRAALSKLLSLPREKVKCTVIFTRTAEMTEF